MKNWLLILFFNIITIPMVISEPLNFKEFEGKYVEASRLYSASRFEDSLKIFDEICLDTFAENYPSVFLSRAMVLHYLKYDEKAKIDIEKCISLQPYSLKPIFCRSIINVGLKDYDRALEDVDYCLEKNPNWADAYHQKGLIFMNMRKYTEALSNFDDAILHDAGQRAELFSDRGFAYYYIQNFEKAKEDFLYSLILKENDDVYLCLIDVCYKMQQYEEGIEYANLLIKKNSRVESAIINRAYIYLVMERYKEVENDLKSIEQSCLELSSYHKVLSIYYMLTDQRSSAISSMNKAYELNPDDNDINLLKSFLNKDKNAVKKRLELLLVD